MPVMFLSDLEAASYGRYGDSVPQADLERFFYEESGQREGCQRPDPSACDEDGCRILNGWAGWLPHGGSKTQVGPVSRCSGRTAGSPLHTRSAGRGWRDSSRAAWSAPRSEGSPVRTCVISGTLAPTSRWPAWTGWPGVGQPHRYHRNRQNRRNREPTRTGSRSGSCTDPRHRPSWVFRSTSPDLTARR